jgi:hypothetical protein
MRIRQETIVAEHVEAGAFDKRKQPKHNPRHARSEYAGLLGTEERKVSWRARFCGLKVCK